MLFPLSPLSSLFPSSPFFLLFFGLSSPPPHFSPAGLSEAVLATMSRETEGNPVRSSTQREMERGERGSLSTRGSVRVGEDASKRK